MENAGTIWSRRRSWTAIALALTALALLQACGDSSKGTGPSGGTAVQLKLRRSNNAQIPSGCQGTYDVSGPGVNINNAPLPSSGQISFQGQVGQTYVVGVELNCGGSTLSGSTQITIQPGSNQAEIVLTVSKVLGLSCTSPVEPGQTSKCTCSVQSPGPANITWQGATPTGPNTANFSRNTPGTYPVTCNLNGVAVATTTVTVRDSGTIQVTVRNSAEFSCCDFFFRFVGVVGTTQLSAGESRTFQVPPGTTFQAACGTSFAGFLLDERVVNTSTTISIDGSSCA
jgi:hypothetical protein